IDVAPQPSIMRASSQMNDIDNHTSACNAFNCNQKESSSHEYQQSMMLKGITLVAVRTTQECHTRNKNCTHEMHSIHSNSARTPPSVQHQLLITSK
nr:hypothetical protein [Tanacetum cinerariifolium]